MVNTVNLNQSLSTVFNLSAELNLSAEARILMIYAYEDERIETPTQWFEYNRNYSIFEPPHDLRLYCSHIA